MSRVLRSTCEGCGAPRVYPEHWACTAGEWTIDLRCPDCEARWTITTRDEAEVAAFDDEMVAATDLIVEAAARLDAETREEAA